MQFWSCVLTVLMMLLLPRDAQAGRYSEYVARGLECRPGSGEEWPHCEQETTFAGVEAKKRLIFCGRLFEDPPLCAVYWWTTELGEDPTSVLRRWREAIGQEYGLLQWSSARHVFWEATWSDGPREAFVGYYPHEVQPVVRAVAGREDFVLNGWFRGGLRVEAPGTVFPVPVCSSTGAMGRVLGPRILPLAPLVRERRRLRFDVVATGIGAFAANMTDEPDGGVELSDGTTGRLYIRGGPSDQEDAAKVEYHLSLRERLQEVNALLLAAAHEAVPEGDPYLQCMSLALGVSDQSHVDQVAAAVKALERDPADP